MVTLIECDRCGSQHGKAVEVGIPQLEGNGNVEHTLGGDQRYVAIDLCLICRRALWQFFQPLPREQPSTA